jgi:hypothetical protein
MVVNMNIVDFWNVMPCGLVKRNTVSETPTAFTFRAQKCDTMQFGRRQPMV